MEDGYIAKDIFSGELLDAPCRIGRPKLRLNDVIKGVLLLGRRYLPTGNRNQWRFYTHTRQDFFFFFTATQENAPLSTDSSFVK